MAKSLQPTLKNGARRSSALQEAVRKGSNARTLTKTPTDTSARSVLPSINKETRKPNDILKGTHRTPARGQRISDTAKANNVAASRQAIVRGTTTKPIQAQIRDSAVTTNVRFSGQGKSDSTPKVLKSEQKKPSEVHDGPKSGPDAPRLEPQTTSMVRNRPLSMSAWRRKQKAKTRKVKEEESEEMGSEEEEIEDEKPEDEQSEDEEPEDEESGNEESENDESEDEEPKHEKPDQVGAKAINPIPISSGSESDFLSDLETESDHSEKDISKGGDSTVTQGRSDKQKRNVVAAAIPVHPSKNHGNTTIKPPITDRPSIPAEGEGQKLDVFSIPKKTTVTPSKVRSTAPPGQPNHADTNANANDNIIEYWKDRAIAAEEGLRAIRDRARRALGETEQQHQDSNPFPRRMETMEDERTWVSANDEGVVDETVSMSEEDEDEANGDVSQPRRGQFHSNTHREWVRGEQENEYEIYPATEYMPLRIEDTMACRKRGVGT